MPQYYFDVKDSVPIRDRVGAELPSDADALTFGNQIADRLRDQGIGGHWYVSVVSENDGEIFRIRVGSESPN